MNKLLLLATAFVAFSPLFAQAATISMSPSAVIVTPGQMITVALDVNPSGATLSAVKVALSYPASLLTPTSFSFAPLWVAVSQQGYDQLGSGLVIKTAGYPGGFSAPTAMGTITFVARATGVATIAVTNDSLALDSNNINALSGTESVAKITINSTGVAPRGPASGSAGRVLGANATGASAGVAEAAMLGTSTSDADASSTIAAASQVAAAAAAGTNVPTWVWWLVLVLLLAALGTWWWVTRKTA